MYLTVLRRIVWLWLAAVQLLAVWLLGLTIHIAIRLFQLVLLFVWAVVVLVKRRSKVKRELAMRRAT